MALDSDECMALDPAECMALDPAECRYTVDVGVPLLDVSSDRSWSKWGKTHYTRIHHAG